MISRHEVEQHEAAREHEEEGARALASRPPRCPVPDEDLHRLGAEVSAVDSDAVS